MVGIPSLPAYVTKILSVTYYANFGLSCPEWRFNGTAFRDARLDRFSCRFGSRSEFTDNVKRLTSRHPDCRQPLPNLVTSELPVIRECLQSVLTSLLAATNRRNRRQFYEKTVSPPLGHRDQAGEVDLVLQYCRIATGSGDNENNRRGDRLPFRRPACGHKRSSNQRN